VGGYGKVSRKCDKGELAKESKIILFKGFFYKIGKAGGKACHMKSEADGV